MLAPLSCHTAFAQDTRELQREATGAQAKKGPHRSRQLMQSANSRLRPELQGHIRAFTLPTLNSKTAPPRSHNAQGCLATCASRDTRAQNRNHRPRPPKHGARRTKSHRHCEAALAYKIEGDKKYLEAAKHYMDAAVSLRCLGLQL